jgi:membrane protein insertase Oxa1/YidC/SpoIIIJ
MFHFFHFLWFDCLYRPIYNLVLYTYQTLPGHDMGLTIIYLALLVRIMLLPVSLAGSNSSRRIQELKPRLDQLQRMSDVGKRRDLIRSLLKRNRVIVYATALVLGAQVLFLGLLYQVFQSGFHHDPTHLAYFEVQQPIDTTFFGWFDLAQKNWWMPLITAISLYIMLSLSTPEPEKGAKVSDVWYVIALPMFVFVVLLFLPSAKSLFVLTSILFSVGLYFVAKYIFRVEPPAVQQDAAD